MTMMARTYTVTVTVTEAGADPDGTARTTDTTSSNPVEITVDDVNEAPMVTRGATMLKHMEYDADTGTDDAETEEMRSKTVSTYTAADPEDASPTDPADVTWSLQGADAGKFSIVSDTGVLTFKEIPNYEMPADAGRNNVYNVTVVATDDATGVGGKMTATREVTIMVTNMDEDGMVTLSAQQPYVGVALTASVTDLDGGVTDVTWKWERDNDLADAEEKYDDEEVIAIGGHIGHLHSD